MDTVNATLKMNHEELFTLLKGFITEVIGAEFVEEMDITPESSFTRDLEMDSIEIVSFSEKIKAHFGDQIDFTGWLSSMDLDQLINLDLSMIINYIYECQ
ncbi:MULTISPECIES: acyl carrier protein [Chryseobacterium]|uniref:Acyl carrier protein n=3 Tax=Chryseobacterium TaxID=59732 RepID=A0A411DKM9_CHRID|nr:MULTISPECIES: phosphopantetheine-binding protein [Chryseobacterium]QBA20929.1 acyl carrier protein [Chryseobacterium indologenes]KYH05875.1 acyl carrier protein [Chryseobacterium cucumeris]MCC3214826.1 phosphopantetheine-binding protein [Chryseobacterium sp. X308]MCP1299420.1 phosphopantetheine-binding protein [Chryseobacterium sp. S0630]MDH5032451.1 phosphopantetheine-binding protein [Chryseobacterium cucumeris]